MHYPRIVRRCLVTAAVGSGVLAAGCSDDQPLQPNTGTGTVGGNPLVERRLQTLDSSAAFFAALRDGLIRQAEHVAPVYYVDSDGASDGGPAPVASPQAAPVAESDTGGETGAGDREVSGTNVQEAGVDEADRVKSDGEFLYVLVEGQNYGGPGDVARPVEPAGEPLPPGSTSPALPPPAASTQLRILSLAPDVPDATVESELNLDLGGRYANGMYLQSSTSGSSAIHIVSSGFQEYWADWQDPYAFQNRSSAVTRVDVNNPQAAVITHGVQFDGTVVSSRRIGNQLFVATRFYPNVPGPSPYAVDADTWRQTVNDTPDEALLPRYRVANSAGDPQPMIDPASCFVAEGPGDAWYAPDIITLATINLDTMTLADSECFLGSTETLYASPNAVYLATTRWNYYNGPVDERAVWADDGYVDPRVDTDIHQFNITSNGLDYTASGSVPGHLGWNELRKPFRMSEKDGRLRVATMSERNHPSVSPINITILEPNGSGDLQRLAVLPNENQPAHIGKPGEQLYASRFLGDTAYLVTFLQTDPLYVIDLSNPSDPRIAGELEIDGYSDYLHPIDENYLLGIGKDAVPAPDRFGDDGRGALVQGVKVALFNVSNPAAPTEVQSMLIGERGTHSNALGNHRAIAVQPATDDHPLRVAFGVDVHGAPNPTSRPSPENAFNYKDWSYTGMQAFEIRTGADAGITSVGTMVVETPNSGGGYYGPSRYDGRSMLVNDAAYYVHGELVFAAPFYNLDNRLGPR